MSAVLEVEQEIAAQKTNGFSTIGVKPHPISVAVYDKMIEHGILDENDQVELLNGVIVEKMPKGTKHTSATSRANRMFFKLFGDKTIIRIQDPNLAR